MAGYRPPYTAEENNIILNFIVEKKAFNILRGNLFWHELEDSGKIQRSWQSLKEHFRKKILPELLVNPKFEIDKKQREEVYYGWLYSSKAGKAKHSTVAAPIDEFRMTSDEEEDQQK